MFRLPYPSRHLREITDSLKWGSFGLIDKRIKDILLSLVSLALLLPVSLPVLLGLKLFFPGIPVFYTQDRYGKDGKVFKIIKLTTLKNEKPVSRLHSWLRKTGLDELPQLIQILSGEMSFVGPRPLSVKEDYIHYLRKQTGIYEMKPGLTGWAQINGGNQLEDKVKTARDLEYKRERSGKVDRQILFETFRQLFNKDSKSSIPGKIHFFILGSKGIPASYGGFETFAEKLVTNSDNSGLVYHVYGMSEKTDMEYKGCDCRYFRSLFGGGLGRSIAVMKQIWAVLKWKNSHPCEKTAVLMLGCRAGWTMPVWKKLLASEGIPVIGNPDGIEEKRVKWKPWTRYLIAWSQKLFLENCDFLVFDSEAVRRYYKGSFSSPSFFIPYGGDDPIHSVDKFESWAQKNRVTPGKFYLMVSRSAPENNHVFVASELESQNIPLVVITDKSKKLKISGNVIIADPVYDEILLAEIRRKAKAVIHAHEAGGTNPGLVEALVQGALVLALATPSNMETAGSSALYFDKRRGSLKSLVSNLTDETALVFRNRGKQLKEKYSWKTVTQDYERIIRSCFSRNNAKKDPEL